MRSKFTSVIAVASLTLVLAAGCAKPKKSDADEGAAAAGETTGSETPAVSDRPISQDPQGSDSGRIDGLQSVNFGYDQATLSADARAKLKANADWIKKNGQYTIQVEGHTDSRGSVEYNLSLGERRAKSVKSYLEGLGVEAKRMTIISYGEEKPIDSGDNDGAFAKNRRANFVPLQ
ncbi:MAG: peptidoglycan-associated lipoprotein Pal [Bdellovibrionota bacterium]